MCGIAGIVWPEKSPIPFVQKALELQRHRGPDGEGSVVFGDTALVHSRLSILDLEGGQQPMETAAHALVFNGEIYNYSELKRDLESKGFRFKTNSDTEVILLGFELWGLKLFGKLRGMFALAILDKKQGRLTLARDPFGIKPVYYFSCPKGFAFSSEIRTLSTCFKPLLRIDSNAISTFLHLQYIPSPNTIFNEIKKLEAGRYLVVSSLGNIESAGTFAELEFSVSKLKPSDLSFEEALETTREVLRESVQAHMLADVEVGTFLSGGIDSTLVTRLAAEVSPKQINTFSIGFSNKTYDESSYARWAAQKLGTRHHEWEVDKITELDFDEMVRSYGEPFGDSSAIPTYFVSKLASNQVKVALTGDGADEMFFGYPRYGFWWQKTQRYQSHANLKKTYVKTMRSLFPERYGLMSGEPTLENWYKNVQMLSPSLLADWCLTENKSSNSIQKQMEAYFKASGQDQPMDLSRQLEIRYYLREDILTKVDIASMRTSLETRPPFVDLKVWDWANQIPHEYLYNVATNSLDFEGKKLLKSLLLDVFPKEFIHRPKMGFGIPLQEWLNRGPLTNAYQEALFSESSSLKDFLNLQEIRKWHGVQVDAGVFETSGQWVLLVLNTWFGQWEKESGMHEYS